MTSSASMPTIAWDVDDVLNDLTFVWFNEDWLPAHPQCAVGWEQLTENPCHETLGISLEAYLQALDRFRDSDMFPALSPRAEIASWFVEHGPRWHHFALTAVPRRAAHRSAAWVFEHFGDWIRGLHFVPSRRATERAPRYDESKAAYLQRIGPVNLFIDDNEQTVAAVKALGIRTLLFPRPWNGMRQESIGQFVRDLTAITREAAQEER